MMRGLRKLGSGLPGLQASPWGFRLRGFYLGALLVLSVLIIPRHAWAERPTAAQLLPESTFIYLRVQNTQDLVAKFQETAMGRMLADPQMKPLAQKLFAEIETMFTPVQQQLGMSLSEILALPQGELAFAIVSVDNGRPSPMLLLDVGEQAPAARKLRERLEVIAQERGGELATEKIGETEIRVMKRPSDPAPVAEEESEKSRVEVQRNQNSAEVRVRARRRDGPSQVVFFEREQLLVLSDNRAVIQWMLQAWNGEQPATFVNHRRFATVMSRCTNDKEGTPQAVWYVDPISFLRRASQGNFSLQASLSVLSGLGLDGIRAIGGSFVLSPADYDSISHIHLSLDNPRAGVVQMVALREGDLTPEPWAPSDAQSYMTLHWDFNQTYSAFGKVYNTFRGENVLSADIKRSISEPLGIDFETELLPLLDGRVTVLQWVEKPVRVNSQTNLIGVKVKDAAVARPLLERLAQKFPDRLTLQPFRGTPVYRLAIPQPANRPADQNVRIPEPAIAIVGDYLLGSDSAQLVEHAITTQSDPNGSLANELDFKLIASKAARLSGKRKPGMLTFSRPEEGLRMMYDMATNDSLRQRLTQQAEQNPAMGILDRTLRANPLPPFAVLAQYLAPAGGAVIDDETGVHYVSFALRRK